MSEQNFNQVIKIADHGNIIVCGEIAFEGKSVAACEDNEMIKSSHNTNLKNRHPHNTQISNDRSDIGFKPRGLAGLSCK